MIAIRLFLSRRLPFTHDKIIEHCAIACFLTFFFPNEDTAHLLISSGVVSIL